MLPQLLVFVGEQGTVELSNLLQASAKEQTGAEICGIVTKFKSKVQALLEKLQLRVPLYDWPNDRFKGDYKKIFWVTEADFAAFICWTEPVSGLNPQKTFNLHEDPLDLSAVLNYSSKEKTFIGLCMHFVTDSNDPRKPLGPGPIFFFKKIPVSNGIRTAKGLLNKIRRTFCLFQPLMVKEIVQGKINWDGLDPTSLRGDGIIKE